MPEKRKTKPGVAYLLRSTRDPVRPFAAALSSALSRVGVACNTNAAPDICQILPNRHQSKQAGHLGRFL